MPSETPPPLPEPDLEEETSAHEPTPSSDGDPAPPPEPETEVVPWQARKRRRRLRLRRRLLGALVLLSPSLWIVGTDLARRWSQVWSLDQLHLLGYWATAAASVVFWTVLLYVAARRRGLIRAATAGLFAALFTLAAGVQGAFHSFYDMYLALDSQVHSKYFVWSLLGYVPLRQPMVVVHLVVALVLSLGLLVLARRYVRPRKWPRRFAPLLVPVVLYGMTQMEASYRGVQSSTPDVIYFHGMMAHVRERLRETDHAPHLRCQRRHPEPVPDMKAEPARPRNVLFIIQESVRYDVSCNEYLEDHSGCATPFSSRATPDRYPLNQWRSNAATTAISISDMWSGVPNTEGHDLLHSVPLIWEYAYAADYDTAYWTSQHVMFGSMRLFVQDLPLSHRAVASNLDPRADFDAGANDGLLTDRVIRDWPELVEPFLAVVHYSNAHYPYVFDEKHAPFQPSEFSKAPGKNQHFFNFYRNVVYLSDLHTGRLIEAIRKTDSGKRTVIVYTSDHAESFREHWQLGHTSSLYDEEIHVPGWVDAPPGTLDEAEGASLAGAKEQFVWHLDVTPTILDLLGLWDAPEMRPFRARMLGHPMTRPQRTVSPVPISNCSWVWECSFRNWGMMQGRMKIEARQWDNEFHCFDVLRDPHEQHNLGEQACAPLPDVAREWFGKMPRQEPPLKKDLMWGPPPPSATAATAVADY